jgi:hypothetical protein
VLEALVMLLLDKTLIFEDLDDVEVDFELCSLVLAR